MSLQQAFETVDPEGPRDAPLDLAAGFGALEPVPTPPPSLPATLEEAAARMQPVPQPTFPVAAAAPGVVTPEASAAIEAAAPGQLALQDTLATLREAPLPTTADEPLGLESLTGAGVQPQAPRGTGSGLRGAAGAIGSIQDQISGFSVPEPDKEETNLQTNLDASRAKFNSVSKEIDDIIAQRTDAKVDPERLKKGQGIGTRIKNAVALFLGGFGAGLTGGTNPVIGILQRQIDADIDAQKEEIAGLDRALVGKQNLLGRIQAQTGQISGSVEAAQAARFQEARIELNKLGSLAQTEQQRANILAADAQLALQQDRLKQEALFKMAAPMRAAQKALQDRQNKKLERFEKAQESFGEGININTTGRIPSPKKVDEINTAKEDAFSLIGSLNEVQTLLKENPSANLVGDNSVAGQMITSKLTSAIARMGTAIGLGTLQPGDIEFTQKILRDPRGIANLFSAGERGDRILRFLKDDAMKQFELKAGGFATIDPKLKLQVLMGGF
jgi:hypothetical protein